MAKATAKEKTDVKGTILTAYIHFSLEHETAPKSVYKFCKELAIDEATFYGHFSSLEAVAESVWETFHHNALDTLQKSNEYEGFSNREKVLSYLFTFFENLTLNRSYVLFSLQGAQKNLAELKVLKGLRKEYKRFIESLIEDENQTKSIEAFKYNKRFFAEAGWAQLLFLLKFYVDDRSQGFEKTDVVIEKSVNTIFDVFDNTPLENAFDLGKFLFKEAFTS